MRQRARAAGSPRLGRNSSLRPPMNPLLARVRPGAVPFSTALIFCLMLLSFGSPLAAGKEAPAKGPDDLYPLLLHDRAAFARQVTAGGSSDLDRARAVATWFARNFDWTATDYEDRTVEQILRRKGGNCAELARVTTAIFSEMGLKMRRVREINIHKESETRQKRAEEKVAENGNAMSVFGRRHNDHVWIEIRDRDTGEWFPADPSLGVVGERDWLEARLGFGERFTLDPISTDMIAPFAVFAADDHGTFTLDRTRHYIIDGFDGLYSGRLHRLPAWPEWVRLVEDLDPKVRGAFGGKVNLHDSGAEIDELAATYDRLKEQFEAAGRPGS